ncbi:MAG: DUF3040 domain-containing protein [Acidimicrobiales bacterium]
MPLSEDEQRILKDIEQHLYETDPALAREVAQTTLYTHAFRNMKWAGLGFVAGAVLMIVLLSTSYLLSFGGFLLMLVSLLYFEHNARKLGRAGLQQVTQNLRGGGGLRSVMGGAGERMRERFRRDGDTDTDP